MNLLKAEYDEMSPITNNLCVLVEEISHGMKSYICMESGYVTNDHLKIGSDLIPVHESSLSQLMRDVKYNDEVRGLVWYPAYMQVEHIVLYCSGTSKDDLKWEVSEVVAVSEEEQEKYPIPGKPGEYFQYRIAVEAAKQFETFSAAMDELYGKF